MFAIRITKKRKRLAGFVAFAAFLAMVFLFGHSAPGNGKTASSELGIYNVSPRGDIAGRSIPASCPSDLHDAPSNYGASCGAHGTGFIQCDGNCSEVDPACDFWVSPDVGVNPGKKAFVLWTCSNADSCSLDNGFGSVSAAGGYRTVFPSDTTTYTLSCSNQFATVTYSATLTVTPLAPVIDSFSFSPSAVPAGSTSTLSWSSTNTTSCSIDNGIGDVGTNGSVDVSPSQDTAYTITCTGAGGTSSPVSATLTVYQPPAVTLFSVLPPAIARGENSSLSWTSLRASSCTIDNNIGSVVPNGSMTINPTQTTTYNITCTGPGGTTSASSLSQTTLVVYQPPSCTYFSPSPSQIVEGNSSILSWGCDNATSCTIDNGIGVKGSSGSATVSPVHTTTYGITCTGPGGSTPYSTTLTVYENPICTFSMSPSAIVPPETSLMSWSCTKATSCSINNGIGSVNTSGSRTIAPASTTTYILTCLGSGNGTIQAHSSFQSTLTVNNPQVREIPP